MAKVDDGTVTQLPAAAVAAYQTDAAAVSDWDTVDLRRFVEQRSRMACEWPGCSLPGEEMAHIFGKGSGGRRSANHPDNVALLCKHHHDVLDGRRRIDATSALDLVDTLPYLVHGCQWYCGLWPIVAHERDRGLCQRHHDVMHGERVVPRRRAELGIALSVVIHHANATLGLAQ